MVDFGSENRFANGFYIDHLCVEVVHGWCDKLAFIYTLKILYCSKLHNLFYIFLSIFSHFIFNSATGYY